jgi:ATP-dependent helicase/DNAse subunit B
VLVAIKTLEKLVPELMGPAFSAIESDRIRRMLSRFLVRDSQRGDFKTSSQEKHFTLLLEGLELSLKIDRIDELNDSSFALIDYKTGGTIKAISALQNARPEEMQLPVYSTAVMRDSPLDVSALAIAQINVKSIDFKALARSANFDPNVAPLTGAKPTAKDKTSVRDTESDAAEWAQKTQGWATLVDELAAEFVSGECRVAPIKSPTVCEYCRLQSVCRINELRSDDGFGGDDDEGAES